MKWLKNIVDGARRLFTGERDDAPARPVITKRMPWQRRRLDEGPADARYLRRKFPNSVFTKPMNAGRAKTIREIMRTLRPDQLAIVYARGWNKGVICPLSAEQIALMDRKAVAAVGA